MAWPATQPLAFAVDEQRHLRSTLPSDLPTFSLLAPRESAAGIPLFTGRFEGTCSPSSPPDAHSGAQLGFVGSVRSSFRICQALRLLALHDDGTAPTFDRPYVRLFQKTDPPDAAKSECKRLANGTVHELLERARTSGSAHACCSVLASHIAPHWDGAGATACEFGPQLQARLSDASWVATTTDEVCAEQPVTRRHQGMFDLVIAGDAAYSAPAEYCALRRGAVVVRDELTFRHSIAGTDAVYDGIFRVPDTPCKLAALARSSKHRAFAELGAANDRFAKACLQPGMPHLAEAVVTAFVAAQRSCSTARCLPSGW